MPDWYRLIQAARYLRVAPWDLAEQNIFWQSAALACMTAEHDAREQRANHSKTRT